MNFGAIEFYILVALEMKSSEGRLIIRVNFLSRRNIEIIIEWNGASQFEHLEYFHESVVDI